jgi:soluble lytic murein transglycosylase-like protein
MRTNVAVWCAGFLLAGSASAQTVYEVRSADGRSSYSNAAPSGSKARVILEISLPRDTQRLMTPPRGDAVTSLQDDVVIRSYIRQAAARHSLDPLLLHALIHQESRFNPRATSPAGARGLMQLMPATALRYGVRNIYDPGENIAGGSAYLRDLIDQFGSLPLALAAYNAGEGAVIRHGGRVPPFAETQAYVDLVVRDYQRRRALAR